MANLDLLTTLFGGVFAALCVFFLLYKVFRREAILSTLLTLGLVLAVYIPLAILFWPGIDVFAIHFAFFVMASYLPGLVFSQRQSIVREGTRTAKAAAWFHWAPASIIAFFLVLAMVDATIITLASKGASSEFMARFLPEPRGGGKVLSSFPGHVSNDYQEKYEQFNNWVEQRLGQRERGWQVDKGWQQPPVVGQPALFQIEVSDKEGAAIAQAVVTAAFLRPGDSRLDRRITLVETQAGIYGQQVSLPLPGRWQVELTIDRAGEVHQLLGTTLVNVE